MRECKEEVLLGTIRFPSCWSRVPGRPSRSPVRGRTKEEWLLSEGGMVADSDEIGLSKLMKLDGMEGSRNMPDIDEEQLGR